MTKNYEPTLTTPTLPEPTDARTAVKRGPVMVLRAGALDYRRYPSLAGGERLAYKSGAHLGGE
jgi:hypothetical protein